MTSKRSVRNAFFFLKHTKERLFSHSRASIVPRRQFVFDISLYFSRKRVLLAFTKDDVALKPFVLVAHEMLERPRRKEAHARFGMTEAPPYCSDLVGDCGRRRFPYSGQFHAALRERKPF